MKKLIKFVFIASCVAFFNVCQSQITLETTYQNASRGLFMLNLETSGMKYVVKSEEPGARFLKFYNLDHSLWKTIDINPMPTTTMIGGFNGPTQNFYFSSLYISEKLFDCDDKIEFLYISSSGNHWITGIYNEDGIPLLEADSCAPYVASTVPQYHRPIYNTTNGTKLILSHQNGSALVYDLPCEMSVGVDGLLPIDNLTELTVYPNPSFYETTVLINLPEHINQAELVIFDLTGKELKRYQVDKTFSNLLLSRDDFSSGTYLYSIISNNTTLISKKVILQ